jgi:hypothetical protein
MKLSKNVRYLVRIRDFETAHVEVGAEISHFDIGYDDEAWAKLHESHRSTFTEHLEMLVNREVDQLARAELETIAEWSEISPNLAEDYLSIKPAHLQRNQHANKKTDTTASGSRRIRRGRGGGPTPTSPSPRPAA